ncbi:MAG TPA: ImmA/IrrE family metallo-endopeptidase [Acidimicrobiales bacterium]|nr:ImmA/IrrE family metallo-endopeptidase [Acidimicrobiales bacterium]
MGKRPSDHVDALEFATHVKAEVRRADELTSPEKLQTLEELQPGAFSACTFTIGEKHIIVYNPVASLGRTQSDIAHEVAHIMLKHEMKTVETIAGLTFFTCDPEEEQEANWLAGCLLLPRRLLYLAARRGMRAPEIAEQFTVSEQMAAFRLRTTGVLRQLEASG